ncbi:uncharacterized protein LOC130760299 isoform X2 [Actinidia eriantha]|uniref:uncharacterized protein LOC130760299 isoform X2 n=1 Tax=Actinidia eriantha TaxID=165200 RepID=UPI00258BBA8A|nr:uncharacterized protein LOC130760299 isoform X2 [Actinidia eriantha]
MVGNTRVELTSGSPEPGYVANYPNGSRGNYPGPSLDRSGSFREAGESRMFGSGASVARVSGPMMGNLPPLSQCLMLEPIIMSDQKHIRSGELRRVLGFSVGSALEDNSFGAAHPRPSPLMPLEELKRYKESILDANNKARVRAKKVDEHLHKLDKYVEAVSSKKQQRNDLSANERSIGLNLKLGNPINRTDLVTQRLENRAKNTVPNRRVRTSMAESQVECRSNGSARQPFVMAKERDMLKDCSPSSHLVEEKIRRLPAGGEGWEKKMKRKRSVGTAFTRSVEIDGELKRPMHHKVSNESGIQSSDAHGFRSGSSSGINGAYKLDSSSSPSSYFSRVTSKHEQEKATLTTDLTAGLNKEKLLAKGNNKLSIREDNQIFGPCPVITGKASRAPRSSSVTAANSSPSIPHVPETPESWEQPSSVNKILSTGGANNRKRAMTTGSSSPPMAQWVGQRPQKISRTRRANLVSPVSKHEEMQISSKGCSPSDFATRINSSGTNDSLLLRGMANGTQQFKVKLENVSSPARVSENEETGAGENTSKENVMSGVEMQEKDVNTVQNDGPSAFLTKKNKSHSKEESSDGVRRQGRSGRGSSFASISPVREKLEITATNKPFRSMRPGSDKNGSKTGRPLKKLWDRRGFSRRGHMPNNGSPDITGDSDDDREELLAAANFAHNASYHACSSSFWKKVEPIFASVSLKDTSYFSQQVKFAEELHESLSPKLCCSHNVLGDLVQEKISTSGIFGSGQMDRSLQNQIKPKLSSEMVILGDQFQEFDTLCGKLDSERRSKKFTPLYQRVLSALIVEDEIEEFEDNDTSRNVSLQYATNDLHCNSEPRKRDGMEIECESKFGAKTWKQCAGNKSFSSARSPVIQNSPLDGELLQGDNRCRYSEVAELAGFSGNDLGGPEIVQTNGLSISSIDSPYEKMSMEDKLLRELQSVGIYLDPVPDLDDEEDETINQDIVQLNKGLHQQIGKKKTCLDKLYKTIQRETEAEARELEQVAMDKLVELAYKKLLATRGSIASKYGTPKVSKQVALGFAKRSLARCQTFDDSGTSCFNEPALRDAIFAAPPHGFEAEPSTCDGLGAGSFHGGAECHDLCSGLETSENFALQSDQAFAKNGPLSNRGKKKEVLFDDVGGSAALRPTSTLASALLGGAKGKRSERERDRDVSSRNTVAKAGRPSLSNLKGERKPKTKPKQKTAQLSTSQNGYLNKHPETTHPLYPLAAGSGDLVNNGSHNKRESGLMSPRTIPRDSSKETKEAVDFTNLPLPDLDSIDELGVGTDLGGPPDLCSWLDFVDDGLQDHHGDGLAIPMDDITELPMF